MTPTRKSRIKRFTPLQRLFHLVLMLTLLIQGATGLARMYIETPWGKGMSRVFGGYESALTVHIGVGIFMISGFLIHVVYILFKVQWKTFPAGLYGPDSILFRLKDIKDFFRHTAWFFGAAEAPEFDRWGYWEKFDYFAVFWGMVILGITGLLLAFPLASSRIIPGWGLNVAFWVHRIEALLAMAHLFVIHFFIAHLRRSNFPMDRTIFEGSADIESVRHERPVWIARLEQSDELENALVVEAMPAQKALYYAIGFAAVGVGLFLLIGAIINAPYITW